MFSTVMSAIFFPLGMFFANIALRSGKSVPQSSSADLLLLWLTFDLTVLMSSNFFVSLVAYESFQKIISVAFGAFLVISLIGWIVSVIILEPRMTYKIKDGRLKYDSNYATWIWISGWVIGIVMTVMHALFFMYEGVSK